MTTDKSGTFTQRLVDGQRGHPRITVGPPLARVPLSSSQQRIYFLCRLAPNASNWQLQRRLVVRGALHKTALVTAFRTLQERHAALRTRLEVDGDELHQVTVAETIAPTIHDWSDLSEDEQETESAAVDAKHGRPFDLHTEPLIRIDIARVGHDHHLLWLTVHHIVCDGWSMRIMMRDLDELYTTGVAGRAPTLPTIPITYADYVTWEQGRLNSVEHKKHLGYWCDQLRGVSPPALPYDINQHVAFPVPRTQRSAKWYFDIDSDLRAKVERLSGQADVTPFVVYLAAFKIVLARYVGSDDIAVAAPAANRSQREARELVGQLFNTILLRTNLGGAMTFDDVLRREREVVLEGIAHQHVPYDEVIRAVEHGLPLFNVMVHPPIGRSGPITLGSLEVVQERREIETPEADLSLYFLPEAENQTDNRIRAVIGYDGYRFSGELIARMGAQFLRLLELVVDASDRSLDELDVLSPDDYAQLAVWNATDREIEGPQLLHELVAAQAARTPDAIAVEDSRQRITYRQLAARIDSVAGWLTANGVARGACVSVAVSRTADLVTAMLGVLRAGAAYVPIDLELPAPRRGFMRDDANAVLEIDDNTLAAALASPAKPPRIETSPENVAYVLYTSGSSGRPKVSAYRTEPS